MTNLPPGQRVRRDFPRFGLPRFARKWIEPPTQPKLEVGGDVDAPATMPLEELGSVPRHTQTSDLHCVTTWTVPALGWSGWRFRDLYEKLLVPAVQPSEPSFVLVGSMDGFRACLPLADALADDVMLVDTLNDVPLTREHGAPLRFVAPAHYAYKSVKHVDRIEFLRAEPVPVFRLEHPRARVALEERHPHLPGRPVGWAYRLAIPFTIAFARRRRGTTPADR